MPFPLYLLLSLSSKSIFKLCLKSQLIFQNKNIFSIKMVDLVTLQESVRDFHVCVWEIVRMSVCKIECIRVCVRERERVRECEGASVWVCVRVSERERVRRGGECVSGCEWVCACVFVCTSACMCLYVCVKANSCRECHTKHLHSDEVSEGRIPFFPHPKKEQPERKSKTRFSKLSAKTHWSRWVQKMQQQMSIL